MQIITFFKNEEKVARAAILVVILALIRCLTEIFRLQSLSNLVLTVENVKPFILGALFSAIAVLLMTILFFYGRHKFIIAISIISIILLLILKYAYSI